MFLHGAEHVYARVSFPSNPTANRVREIGARLYIRVSYISLIDLCLAISLDSCLDCEDVINSILSSGMLTKPT